MALLVQVRSERTRAAFGGAVELHGELVGDRRRVAAVLKAMRQAVLAGELDDMVIVESGDPDTVAMAQEHAHDVVVPVPSGLMPGRIVMYRSKVRPYTLAAIVTATVESLDPIGVERGDVRGLSSASHVHLNVQTPGEAENYPEYDVPMFDGQGLPVTIRPRPGAGEMEPRMGSWYWPPRASS